MVEFIAWHYKSLAEHESLRDNAAKNGFRFLSLSIHGSASDPYYTAVMILRAQVISQRDWPTLTAAEFQATFDAQAKLGYGPVIIAATGTAANPLFAGVFQPTSTIPLTRFGLTSGSSTDPNTIQGVNTNAHNNGLIPLWLAVYGDSNSPAFAGIWVPNTDKVIWNADGLVESASGYQMRFNAQTSAWCRPSLVTVSPDVNYMSLFVDNEVGPWVARHGMTADEYQTEFNTWTQKGFFPINVQGGGTGAATRWAALFVQTEQTTPKHFSATGPVANPAIDAVIQQAMQNSPVRHASLSIVHGTQLVYTRGYTWGEPGWPAVQPTSYFRQASVSKTVTALAIYQLIEQNQLNLTEKLQDILQLRTPSGQPPSTQFSSITIRQLLEHTSGLLANGFDLDVIIRDAFRAAQPTSKWSLPVTTDMRSSYVSMLDLVTAPGTKQEYNNCGYDMLGLVLARKRNRPTAIQAMQDFLFAPLHITRIRRGTSLISATPADEARYRALDIPLAPSVFSDDQPLVPMGYGNEIYEDKEGGGGLSAATTDLARLIAILLSPKDNPALRRSTILELLDSAVGNQAAWSGRAGYGFDGASYEGGEKFYAQKGGSLWSSGTVLEINGSWGFAMSWAGNPAGAPANWYPDFPDVMNIARGVAWNSTDLFPSFGMPSL